MFSTKTLSIIFIFAVGTVYGESRCPQSNGIATDHAGGTYEAYHDRDFLGKFDMAQVKVSSLEECMQACTKRNDCHGVVFAQDVAPFCYLKHDYGTDCGTPSVYNLYLKVPKPVAVTGKSVCGESNGILRDVVGGQYEAHYERDLLGYDIQIVHQFSVENCLATCSKRHDCRGIVYAASAPHQCFLKGNIALQNMCGTKAPWQLYLKVAEA